MDGEINSDPEEKERGEIQSRYCTTTNVCLRRKFLKAQMKMKDEARFHIDI